MDPLDPRHGTVAGHCAHHTDGESPCFPCRLAKAAYETERKRLMAYGRWQPWTDAEPARQHVRSLMAQGMTTRQIGTKAGVAYSRITNLVYGRGGRPPVAKMRPEFAATLLAIQPEPARYPVHGVSRRLQALVAVGYSGPYLAGRLGFSQARVEQFLKGRCISENVMAEMHHRVDDLYRELHMRPRVGTTAREKQSVSRAKHTAAVNGWVSGMAWDDIDNPDATPNVGGHSNRDVAGEYEHLASFGVSFDNAARQLGLTPRSLETALLRARKEAS